MMTDRKQSLQDLVAKVEAGEIKDGPFWKIWRPECEDGVLSYRACDAANGSLDAAKSLHEAVLHERLEVVMTYTPRYENECSVRIWHPTDGEWIGRADNPARAWLVAILKALIAKEGEA